MSVVVFEAELSCWSDTAKESFFWYRRTVEKSTVMEGLWHTFERIDNGRGSTVNSAESFQLWFFYLFFCFISVLDCGFCLFILIDEKKEKKNERNITEEKEGKRGSLRDWLDDDRDGLFDKVDDNKEGSLGTRHAVLQNEDVKRKRAIYQERDRRERDLWCVSFSRDVDVFIKTGNNSRNMEMRKHHLKDNDAMWVCVCVCEWYLVTFFLVCFCRSAWKMYKRIDSSRRNEWHT